MLSEMDKKRMDEVVEELLHRMSLREKLGQCVMIEPCFCFQDVNDDEEDEATYDGVDDPRFLDRMINDYHIGLFLFGGVSRIGDDSVDAWTSYFNKVNRVAAGSKNKIPMLYAVDAVHGVNFIQGTTVFPHNLGVVASWNPEIAKDYAALVGEELSSLGINVNFAPTIDVARDQRWGRVYESLGEDPYLASRMSEAMVEGMQQNGKVAACAKHFIGYGESANGMDRTPANLSDRTIIENHRPPFDAAIKKDVLTMMVNGGDVNGTPMPASKKLMTDMLRNDMGYEGVTMSDWEDVIRLKDRHRVAATRKEAIARAFNAGLDMNMAVSDFRAVDVMEELVEEGTITNDRVDEAVRRILKLKYKLGLLTNEPTHFEAAKALPAVKESKALARQVVRESLTLIKNDDKLLPLDPSVKSILVTGERADTKRHLCGGWTLSWGSAEEDELSCMTILEAIREKVSSETKVTYVADAETLHSLSISSADYDVCISVVGEEPHSEWIGDTPSLEMEPDEVKLLEAVSELAIPTVMVGVIGRPQQLKWADQNMDSILWAFVPGTEGALPIAEALFGEFSPAGCLPISFPKDANQIPISYNMRKYVCDEMNTSYEPLYPFGHGLSYTTFEYSDLKVPEIVEQGKDLEVSLKVTNTGAVASETVLQLYLEDLFASVTRPFKSLKAFKRIHLETGESKEVSLTVEANELGLYDEMMKYVIEKREIEVSVEDLKAKFKIL